MRQNNGGPAFTQTQTLDTETPGRAFISGADVGEAGMTLRDYFAAKAMAAFIAATADDTEMETEIAFKAISIMAYGQADAMLKARES